jgi:hypothetical protein
LLRTIDLDPGSFYFLIAFNMYISPKKDKTAFENMFGILKTLTIPMSEKKRV